MLEAHMTAMPVIRWVGMGYETDAEVWKCQVLKDGEEQFWLGNTLMIGGVSEPGLRKPESTCPNATPRTRAS